MNNPGQVHQANCKTAGVPGVELAEAENLEVFRGYCSRVKNATVKDRTKGGCKCG